MIHEVSGDILLSSARAIAHGVAPNDPFHSGLALALREKYPAMYKDFRHYGQNTHPKSGTIWSWAGVGEGAHQTVQIVALLTQEGGFLHGDKPGPAHANFVNHALKALHTWVENEKIESLALPRLCTGVGGLAWETVLPLIQTHFGAMKLPVYVYSTYVKDVKGEEAG